VNALADPEVGAYLGRHFTASFQKVATFRIVNGQKQGGNVAAYFCAPDGRVLHAVAGPVPARVLLAEARWVVESARAAVEESRCSGVPFKVIFRRLHAERLRAEHGLAVRPVEFDPVDPPGEGPLTWRDPSGRPLAPVLPPPPIDGPDVSLRERAAKSLSAAAEGAGVRAPANNLARVHRLLAAYALLPIERLYGTVFENILGERVSTQPVVVVGGAGSRKTDVGLRCPARDNQ
jgi:hypothetical protein